MSYSQAMATLYIVGTPIGNLEDITLRALETLKTVDLILCEDTRVTGKLLNRHGINTPTLSYHAHSKLSRMNEVTALLKEGKNLALVSDAGTPGISDPGCELVKHIREECVEEIACGNIKIESVPGPSAITAALSIAGVPCSDFTFLGFLPHKKGRETLFKKIAESERTVVFYESPHRMMKMLGSLVRHLEFRIASAASVELFESEDSSESERPATNVDFDRAPSLRGARQTKTFRRGEEDAVALKSKNVTVCRELTKIFEEVISGSAKDVKDYFENNTDKIRGEFVVIVK